MKRPNGAVFYEGPSALTGAPIAGIVTGLASKSRNEKTGSMLQTWFLRQDMEPLEALNQGTDDAVCGDCPLKKDICYVSVYQAPQQVWRAWAAGRYLTIPLADLAKRIEGQALRWGAYGDPLSVPASVVSALGSQVKNSTGYTHQWRGLESAIEIRTWQRTVMASCETEDSAREATALGWRTFRVKPVGSRRLSGEKPCPAGPTNSRVQCISCPNPCSGGDGPFITIDAHGSGATRLTT